MNADMALVRLLEHGTAAPSPVRRDRWFIHVSYVPSETPLPEHFATYADQATSAPIGVRLLTDQSAHIADLREARTFAQIVAQVMPVDDELDRRAALALRKRAAGQRPRKLTQK